MQYTPNQVKDAVAGWGGADKAQVQKMVQSRLGLSSLPRPADAADAAARGNLRDVLLSVGLYAAFDFVGQLFLNALKMLIVPLIASSIALGVAGLGNTDSLGSMGFKTALFYVLTTGAAILTGLIIVNLVQPGIVDGKPAGDLLALAANPADLEERIAGRGLGEIPQILLRAVPQNILAAAADNEMLALIFFSALFGYFMSQIEHELAETLYRFTSAVF